MKKHFKFLFFPLFLFLGIKTSAEEMPLYKQSAHIQLFCLEQDQKVGDLLLESLENNFAKFSKDFDYTYTENIKMMLYPNIGALHEAIDQPAAPDWLVGCSDPENHLIMVVSPNNPGPVHNYESIFRVANVDLANRFISEKYKNKNRPRWLQEGVAFLESNYFTRPVVKEWLSDVAKDHLTIPSLEEMDRAQNNKAFFEIDGFRICYSLVEFLNEKWGWNKLMELLDDYGSFEKILNLSKEEFRKEWIFFLKIKYSVDLESEKVLSK